jgi:hypothetical protein
MSDIARGRALVGFGEERRNIPVAPLAEPAFDAHQSTDNPCRRRTKLLRPQRGPQRAETSLLADDRFQHLGASRPDDPFADRAFAAVQAGSARQLTTASRERSRQHSGDRTTASRRERERDT